MKNKHLIIIGFLALLVLVCSCDKINDPEDKNKIDIKGTLMNGDMRYPNIVATYKDKTLNVEFYDELGECIVSVANKQDSVVFCDTISTYPYASTKFYMGDLPKERYRLHITNGRLEAEGWFNNFRLVAVRPQ